MSNTVQPDTPTQSHPQQAVAALFDRYEVRGVIGQGGMGTVYKGYHLNLKRFVAIKILRLDRIASPTLLSRFLREMEAVGQMDHPNVVRAMDAGEKNGLFYLVMEYLDGKNLASLIGGRDRLAPSDACELARQTAVGLDYIHQRLVHRDIKPSNLILTPAGLVKILDLGLARLHEGDGAAKERTPEGCALGTFDYMAPEQASGSSLVDGRTDVYSLGCTLFKLLTGQPPFAGPDYDSVARKLFAHGHVPLTALAEFESIPEGLRPVLLRMTAKEPDQRYQTAEEAARALAPFAAGSQPARLLESNGRAGEVTVDPLPVPLPEELSRLSGPVSPTRLQTLRAPSGPAFTWRRLFLGAGALACLLAAAAWFLVPREQAVRQPLPEEIPLPPPAAPLVALSRLPALSMTNLLGSDAAPTLVGFRRGDGQSIGRWMPGRQQVEISPTGNVLMLMADEDRPAAGFDFEVLLEQRPWSGDVGLFWGYQEDAAAKAARQPGRDFARCQTLLLIRGRGANGGVLSYVERSACRLQYDKAGDVAVSRTNASRDDLPNFGGEKLFQIEVNAGQLHSARFGDAPLANAVLPGTNALFQPADYRGAFGVITLSATAEVRRPWVMPHAND